MNVLNYVSCLAKIGERIPVIGRITKRLITPEFVEATQFLYQNTLTPINLLGGIVIAGVTVFCVSTFLLSLLLNILSAIVLGTTIALMSGLILFNSVVSKYNRQLMLIEKSTPYVLEELATIFLSTGSVFDAIQYVSRGDYGGISIAFTKMLTPLNHGSPPEQLLQKFARNQPSMTLRRGLLTFIQTIESSTTNLDAVILDAHENIQRKYERLTLQWESRMMVLAGLLVFLPIIFILGAAIRGLADHPLILLLPIFQFGLSKIMLRTLLPNELILLGE